MPVFSPWVRRRRLPRWRRRRSGLTGVGAIIGLGALNVARTNLHHSTIHAARTAITNKTTDAPAKSTNLIMTLFMSAWTRLWAIRSAT
jgi:hypothetical protein